MYISIDFDDTIVIDDHHVIIKEVPSAINTIRELKENGNILILETMRSGNDLDEAISWLKQQDIVFDYVNENPVQKDWTTSPKIYADIYIDNLSINCPLVYNKNYQYSYVDWIKVRKILIKKNFL